MSSLAEIKRNGKKREKLTDKQVREITEYLATGKIHELMVRVAELEILNDILQKDLRAEKAKHETVRI